MRWMVFVLLGVLVLGVTGSLGQNGFQGEHEYQGTQEDALSGDFDGVFTPEGNGGPPQEETLIREYTAFATWTPPTTQNVDFTPYSLDGVVDTSSSKTKIVAGVSCGFEGGSESVCNLNFEINSVAISDLPGSTCDQNLWVSSAGSTTNPSRGHGYTQMACTVDYIEGINEIRAVLSPTQISRSSHTYEIIQIEVYNRTIPSQAPAGGSISGTFTGTSTGTHTGEIEDLNLTTQNESADESGFDLFTAAFTDAAGLSALEFMVAPLIGFLGVFLWSRANDSVVRVLGGLLVVFAGLLLLSVGIEQGFGDVWIGLSSFAVILMVVGGYLVVRVFIDHFGGDPQSE